jgi:hypothetical protein
LDDALHKLFRAIAERDPAAALRLIERSPSLAHRSASEGATRAEATPWFLEGIEHYIYLGDTALHVAAAAYDEKVARALIARGADVRAANRRGAEPLHYAADGDPTSRGWNPVAQAAMVALLVEAGADPDARNTDGVAPLHRAVRTRCTGAVRALLTAGANPRLPNGRGSTPLDLATRDTGRGGSGTGEARLEQQEIIVLLQGRTVDPLRPHA